MEFKKISATRISTGTVYKLWFVGLLTVMLPFGTLAGVLAAFGFNTVTWNGQLLHGFSGLVGGTFIGVFFPVLATSIFGSVSALGLWLFSKFRPISVSLQCSSVAAAE